MLVFFLKKYPISGSNPGPEKIYFSLSRLRNLPKLVLIINISVLMGIFLNSVSRLLTLIMRMRQYFEQLNSKKVLIHR